MTGGSGEPLALHERHMARALELAERGRATVRPNPMVGCVIVRDDEVVGEGWHERAGEPHAEVHALRQAGGLARGADVYVTLEPCSHHGRTPPCADALIEAGVRRVVIAAGDPDPRVDGAGVERLRAAGIEVVQGVLREEAEAQNERFRTAHRERRPYVLYKTAMTLDGKIATRSGQSRWITGEAARARVQAWRAELDAVAVGVTTVLLDDPRLTVRGGDGQAAGRRSPTKVVFDSVARTPETAALFEPGEDGEGARVILVVGESAPAARVAALEARGAEVLTVPGPRGRTGVREALTALYERGLSGLLLEGGGTLAWSFFEARAVDRVAWFVGPKLLGGRGASPLGGLGVGRMEDALGLTELRSEFIGQDLLLTGRVAYPDPGPEEAA